MRRFTSGAEALVARAVVHRRAACRARGRAVAVAARRRSAPGSSSLRPSRPGNRRESPQRACGSSTSTERRAASAAARRAPRRTARRTSASTPSPTNAARHADAEHRATSPVSAATKSGTGSRAARRVGGVGAGDHVQQRAPRRATVRVERPDLIERRGEREQAVARDASVGRLQPDEAAERGRLADRSAGVGSERGRHQAGGDRDRRSAARPARRARRIPRVARRAEGRVLGRRAHRELVAVGLADDDGAGRARRRSTTVASYGGHVAARGSSTTAVVGTPRVQMLSLSATGTPASGPRVAAGARRSRPARASACSPSTGNEGVKRRVLRVDAASGAAADLDGRGRAGGDGIADGGRASTGRARHQPMTRGTRKRPAVQCRVRARSRALVTGERRARHVRPVEGSLR